MTPGDEQVLAAASAVLAAARAHLDALQEAPHPLVDMDKLTAAMKTMACAGEVLTTIAGSFPSLVQNPRQ